MRQKFFIVRNQGAGVPRHRFFADVVAALGARGAVVTIFDSADADAAAAAIRKAAGHYDAIVAAGGDGTFRRVAIAIGDAAIPLGLIPLGTGNVLAREAGLKIGARDVADVLIDGRLATIRGAKANNSAFFLMAGVGFDGRVIAGLDQRLKRLLGRAAYADTATRALLQPADQLEVTIDGERHGANWLIVTNSRHYGGGFILRPQASVFRPGLEVVLIRAQTRSELFGQLLRLSRGTLTAAGNARVRVLAARTVQVTAAGAAVPVQLDGDSFGTTPLSIDADGPQIGLIVPG
jgi:diacylglycerol kinase (ATP)